MLFTLAVRGEVSNHLMHALRYLRANGLVLSEQHCPQSPFLKGGEHVEFSNGLFGFKDCMRTLHHIVLIFSLLTLVGCGTAGLESKRVDYKSGTVKVAPLDVPPDLTAPETGDRFTIPENGGEVVAVYSDYSKVVDSVAAPQVLHTPEAVREFQLAVMRRDVRKLQLDVAMRASPDQQFPLEQRDWVAAAAGNQFAEHLRCGHNHDCVLGDDCRCDVFIGGGTNCCRANTRRCAMPRQEKQSESIADH